MIMVTGVRKGNCLAAVWLYEKSRRWAGFGTWRSLATWAEMASR